MSKIHANGAKKPRRCGPQTPIRPKLSDGSFLTSDHVSASPASPATCDPRESNPYIGSAYGGILSPCSHVWRPKEQQKRGDRRFLCPQTTETPPEDPSAALHIPLSSCNLKYPYHGIIIALRLLTAALILQANSAHRNPRHHQNTGTYPMPNLHRHLASPHT